MPDKTPLSPEMFQFTAEELTLASPEVLEVLMQNGTVVPSLIPAPPSTTSNSNGSNNAAPPASAAPVPAAPIVQADTIVESDTA